MGQACDFTNAWVEKRKMKRSINHSRAEHAGRGDYAHVVGLSVLLLSGVLWLKSYVSQLKKKKELSIRPGASRRSVDPRRMPRWIYRSATYVPPGLAPILFSYPITTRPPLSALIVHAHRPEGLCNFCMDGLVHAHEQSAMKFCFWQY